MKFELFWICLSLCLKPKEKPWKLFLSLSLATIQSEFFENKPKPEWSDEHLSPRNSFDKTFDHTDNDLFDCLHLCLLSWDEQKDYTDIKVRILSKNFVKSFNY